jgi:hypothetical protein
LRRVARENTNKTAKRFLGLTIDHRLVALARIIVGRIAPS